MKSGRPRATEWQGHADRLVDRLVELGHLRSTVWSTAFRATPRHLFLDRPAQVPESAWPAAAYDDITVVTQVRARSATGESPVPTSSSTRPSLMSDMLELLTAGPSTRILEIGTGTGYNAGVMASAVGSGNVVSIDLDPRLIESARTRLSALGHAPTLLVGDGAAGAPDHGPFDRIIATCAVDRVPVPWIEQLAPGGLLLVNLRGQHAGVLCLLRKTADDQIVGPVVAHGSDFMWMRTTLDNPLRDDQPRSLIGVRDVARRFTATPPDLVDTDAGLRWMVQLAVAGIASVRRTTLFDPSSGSDVAGVVVSGSDGSHAQVVATPEPDSTHRVLQGGPRRLWDSIETAHADWRRTKQPLPERFGVVATSTSQFVWLDSETSWRRWPLPLDPTWAVQPTSGTAGPSRSSASTMR